MLDLNIEYKLLADINPYKNNAKIHSKKQVKKLSESIKNFRFNNPILISDHNEIIAGHGRYDAAKLLGISKVPCIVLSHLTEADKKAYVLADNRLSEIGS